MLSVHNGTTEKNSAKKAARRENRWVFPVVLLLSALICSLGAALIYKLYAPEEYSEAEVDEYVKNIYGDSWKLQKKTALSSEKGAGTRYLYAGGEGGSFSVFVISVPVYENGQATGRWKKALSDNYFSTVIEKNMDALKKLEEKTEKDPDLCLEIEKTGEDSGIYGATYTFRMYLEEIDGFSKAADIVGKMDELFSFSCKKGTSPYDKMRMDVPSIQIYMKPEKSGPAADVITSTAPIVQEGETEKIPNLTTDWSAVGERDKYRISTISFTDASSASRLKSEDVFIRIENDYVDLAKTTGSTFYAASSELREKYPAPVLTLINVGSYDISKNVDLKEADGEELTDSEEDDDEAAGEDEDDAAEEPDSEEDDNKKAGGQDDASEEDDDKKAADQDDDAEEDDDEAAGQDEDDAAEEPDSEEDDGKKAADKDDTAEQKASEKADGEETDGKEDDDEEAEDEDSDDKKDGSGASESKKQFTYQFIYHRGTGTYWLAGLDPCEDFDENPFGDYARRGAFARLVEYLGGTYSCEDWNASWKIGDTRWTASAETQNTGKSPYTYKKIDLFRNGNHEKLDEVPEVFEGIGAVPSGRPYSIRDLIRMFDVRITINQKEMTAVMFRDF